MSYIRKIHRKLKGARYRVEVLFKDGNKRSKTFRLKEEAQRWGRMQEELDDARVGTAVIRPRLTFEEYYAKWFDEYAKQHHSPGWQQTDGVMFRLHLKKPLGQKVLQEIHPEDVREVLNGMGRQGLSPATRNRVRQLMNKMFIEAVRVYRYVDYNPVAAIRPLRETPKPIDPLDEENARKLLIWADSHPLGIFIHLGLQLGLREGEMVALKWDSVDSHQRRVIIRRKYQKKVKVIEEFPKGRKYRILGLHPEELFQRLVRQRNRFPHSQFVICQNDGGMVLPHHLIIVLRRAIRELNIPSITVHGLRHTYATLYMQNGGDLYDLQKLLGHQSISTTELYRHTQAGYLASKCKLNLYANSAQIPPKNAEAGLYLVENGGVSP